MNKLVTCVFLCLPLVASAEERSDPGWLDTAFRVFHEERAERERHRDAHTAAGHASQIVRRAQQLGAELNGRLQNLFMPYRPFLPSDAPGKLELEERDGVTHALQQGARPGIVSRLRDGGPRGVRAVSLKNPHSGYDANFGVRVHGDEALTVWTSADEPITLARSHSVLPFTRDPADESWAKDVRSATLRARLFGKPHPIGEVYRQLPRAYRGQFERQGPSALVRHSARDSTRPRGATSSEIQRTRRYELRIGMATFPISRQAYASLADRRRK